MYASQFFRLLLRHEIANPLDYDDIADDIREECSMHGAVSEVNILKPMDDDPEARKGMDPVDVSTKYDIASLCMVSFYCFVTNACAQRPGDAASQAFKRMHFPCVSMGDETTCRGMTLPST